MSSKCFMFFILVFLFPKIGNTQPVVIGMGQTLVIASNTAAPFPDGIIIESGGVLDIQPNAYVGIGVGESIRVMDGGTILCNYGTISVIHEALPGNWYGIDFDGTNNVDPASAPAAMTMVGGAIRRADYAVAMTQGNYRKLIFNGTTFENNGMHIWAQAGAVLFSSNGSRFSKCNFLQTNGFWPILIGYMNDIQFDLCYFNYEPAAGNIQPRMIHIDGPTDVVIKNCVFVYTKNAISLHFNINNTTVSDCRFIFNEAYSSSAGFDVLEVGLEGSNKNTNNVDILNNTFYSNNKGIFTYGIRVHINDCNDLNISGNKIGVPPTGGGQYGFSNGIYIEKANEGGNVISGNIIENCGYGINCGPDNPELQIMCNVLKNNGTHLYATGLLATQLQNGLDPNNQYLNAKFFDIDNQYSSTLIYNTLNFVPINGHPPTIINNVQLQFVSTVSHCIPPEEDPNDPEPGPGGDTGGERSPYSSGSFTKPVDTYIFPNPANDIINGIVDLDINKSANVTINSMTGMVLMEQQITGNQQVSFDISTLPAGMYLFSVVKDGGEPVTKRFSVIR